MCFESFCRVFLGKGRVRFVFYRDFIGIGVEDGWGFF